MILLIVCLALIATNAKEPSIDQIWLGHRSHDPGKLVVNWISKEPGESIVRFGRTDEYGQEVRIANDTTLHHVEIPLVETGGVYHYSVHTGNQSSKGFTFKAYPEDVLRVAVVADWQGLPDLSAIKKDDVHLLVTAGDNIKNIHQLCGAGKKACVKPYLQLIERYPELFRSVPFMPVLGNHDKQIRPRGNKPPSQPVYDIEATAFRQFFELPGDEWKWHFDIPGFDIRFARSASHLGSGQYLAVMPFIWKRFRTISLVRQTDEEQGAEVRRNSLQRKKRIHAGTSSGGMACLVSQGYDRDHWFRPLRRTSRGRWLSLL